MDTEMRKALHKELQCILGKKALLENAPMSRYTSLKLGGPAEMLCEIDSSQGLADALKIGRRHKAPVTLVGNGSNLLVKDGGIRGLVLHIGAGMGSISAPTPLTDGRFAITAQAGAPLGKLCHVAAEHSLTGLEFAAGIPGTVGGAVYMNAGAYGSEMKDVVTSVTAYDFEGNSLHLKDDEMDFGYRKSRLSSAEEPLAAFEVTFALAKGDGETILAAMHELNARRREKQPISQPSCGSTFKRPEGQFAGTLIEQCGLKGFRIGGASVSELHAGFLINDREGTAADFLALIAHVQRTVHEKKGVMLEPEVRILGEDAPELLV